MLLLISDNHTCREPEVVALGLLQIKGNRAEIAKLKASARDASRSADQRTAAAARSELGLDAAPAGASGSSQSQRDRMLSATETLQKSSDRIRQGQQSLLQTEELGANILQDLHRQRETINHTRETLKTTDENIGTARKVLLSSSARIPPPPPPLLPPFTSTSHIFHTAELHHSSLTDSSEPVIAGSFGVVLSALLLLLQVLKSLSRWIW